MTTLLPSSSSPLPLRPTAAFDIPIVWIGCHPNNMWHTDGNLPKELVVQHIMSGTINGCDAWFNDPRAAASSTFAIPKLPGPIHQYLETRGQAPYANGASYHPDMSQRVKTLTQKHGGVSQNWWTHSIEYEGLHTDDLTPFQLNAGPKLNALLLQDMQRSNNETAGHYEFDPVNRKFCPDFTVNEWAALRASIYQIMQNQGQDTMTPEQLAIFNKMQADIAHLLYFVDQSHHPWLTDLHHQIFDVIFPRLQNVENAILVMRDIMGQQGSRIQAVEDWQLRHSTPAINLENRAPANSAFIETGLNHILLRMESQPPLNSYKEIPHDYLRSPDEQQSAQSVQSAMRADQGEPMRADGVQSDTDFVVDQLHTIARDIGRLASMLPGSAPPPQSADQPVYQTASGEASRLSAQTPFTDSHGDMPPEFRNL